MIIGLTSNQGCGKDTTALYLQDKKFVPIGFADCLKQFTSKVFPFSQETLFGSSEKRNERFPEGGTEEYWFSITAKLMGLKPELAKLFPSLPIDDVMAAFFQALQHIKVKAINEGFISGRYCLQYFGTDFARSLDVDVWVKQTKRNIDLILQGCRYDRITGIGNRNPTRPVIAGVVICDVRFVSELDAVKSWGGKTVWVDASKRITPDYSHSSEPRASEFIPLVDYVLDNNQSIGQLQFEVEKMLFTFVR